jgi:hypothetical protein
MSGGHFDHLHWQVKNLANSIEEELADIEIRNFDSKTVSEFVNAVVILKKAAVYSERIDYLLTSDDSEETFHERLASDLKDIEVPAVSYTGMEHVYRVKFYGDDDIFLNGVTNYLNLIGGRTKEEARNKVFELFEKMTGHKSKDFIQYHMDDMQNYLKNSDCWSTYGNWEIIVQYYHLGEGK